MPSTTCRAHIPSIIPTPSQSVSVTQLGINPMQQYEEGKMCQRICSLMLGIAKNVLASEFNGVVMR
eukprot:1190583-Prorocentrum_minimum.AAC.3